MSVPTDIESSALAPSQPKRWALRSHASIDDARASGLRIAAGLLAGFALLAIVDACAIAIAVPWPAAGAALRVRHHVFDAAETIGIGAALAVVIGATRAFARMPVWAEAALYALGASPIQYAALGDDLRRQACSVLDGRFETPLTVLLVALTSLALPAAHVLGALISTLPRIRLVPAAIALGAMITDHLFLRDDYFGLHASIAWTAATLGGAALAPIADRALRSLARRSVALPACAGFAIFGLAVAPPPAVRVELFRQPCAIAPWVLAATVWRAPKTHAPPPSSPWFCDRSALPPIAPTRPRVLPANAVVVVITIDALRADAVLDPANNALFPTFADMKKRGLVFTDAIAPGSQTAVSLTTTFSSRYYSELHWADYGVGLSRFLYASADPAPRFPALLTERGVATASVCSINFMAGAYGVARGFREERIVASGRQHALARHVIEPLLERLRRTEAEPLFAYAHLMEPHAPYDRGRKDGTEWERYLSEIAVADAQIGRVEHALEQRFPGRWMLVVSADHGEAFGEHDTWQHTKTLYQELVHVPLLVRGAGIAPRIVHERVGLIDLGPTMLDLFGVETPASFEGQSLVPILAGRSASLDRPILAEGRLRRAIWTADGLKVIEDTRRRTVEAYDLTRDPGEKHNLFDGEPGRADAALSALRAFFAAQEARGERYREPYKP